MIKQNIYTFEYDVYCLHDDQKSIIKYLQEAFNHIASRVVSVKVPVDWLVVKSDSLLDIIWGSQYLFEEKFEKDLKSQTSDKVHVYRKHSTFHAGSISNDDIEEWIKERLKQDFEPNYLNEPNLGTSFIGYHLKIEKSLSLIK